MNSRLILEVREFFFSRNVTSKSTSRGFLLPAQAPLRWAWFTCLQRRTIWLAWRLPPELPCQLFLTLYVTGAMSTPPPTAHTLFPCVCFSSLLGDPLKRICAGKWESVTTAGNERELMTAKCVSGASMSQECIFPKWAHHGWPVPWQSCELILPFTDVPDGLRWTGQEGCGEGEALCLQGGLGDPWDGPPGLLVFKWIAIWDAKLWPERLWCRIYLCPPKSYPEIPWTAYGC